MTDITFLERSAVTRGDVDFSPIEALGNVVYCGEERTDWAADALPQAVKNAQVLILNKTKITRAFLEQCPRLRLISILATGYNNIDLQAAKERGVCVCNVPGYSTDSVAQLTFGLILQLAGSLFAYETSVQNGDWCRAPGYTYLDYPITQLAGKTLGIVGYGAIGKKVALIGKAFGMNLTVTTRTVPEDTQGAAFVPLETLLHTADFVTLHCPLTEQTKGMLSGERLLQMKPSAFLINTSRGAVVEEQALADALNNGVIAGAGIDVLETEPMPKDCPLLHAKNCLITPHVAWAAAEARRKLLYETEQNIRAFLDGRPRNRVG